MSHPRLLLWITVACVGWMASAMQVGYGAENSQPLRKTVQSAATATARLSRNAVESGVSVRLIIKTTVENVGRGPDLSVLSSNFEVLSSATNTSVSHTNGVRSKNTQWIIELVARRSGNLTIPAFVIGNTRTQALTLRVRPPTPNASSGRNLYIRVEVSPKRPLVQQQITYIVRLYRLVDILNGTLSEPAAKEMEVRRLGGDKTYTQTIGGRSYGVVERRYAMFAQRSGEFTVPPVVFEGRILDKNTSQSNLQKLFRNGQHRRIRGPKKTLKVQPHPADFVGRNWLPATSVSLQDSWEDHLPALQVGVPITRRINILATGVLPEQLPSLDLALPDTLRGYTDKPTGSVQVRNRKLMAKSKQSVAIVPKQAGYIQLPEIRLPWWDVSTGVMRTAVLPARELSVAAADSITEAEDLATVVGSTDGAVISLWDPRLWSAIAGLLVMGGGITAAFGWWYSRSSQTAKNRNNFAFRRVDSCAKTCKTLLAACARNDPKAAHVALVKWGQCAWPSDVPTGPLELVSRIKQPTLTTAVRDLEHVIYAAGDVRQGEQGPSWYSEPLAKAAMQFLAKAPATAVNTPNSLPGLYPRE